MHIRILTQLDVPAGLRLNTISGWNQTATDWQRFLQESPNGCFVMECDGKVVGTVATITYENRFSWIGMVLVDPEYRKRGIGTELLNKAIAYLDQRRIMTLKLDATPQGKPLYAKLGFATEYEIERWTLRKPSLSSSNAVARSEPPVRPASARLEQIVELDKELFGADRSVLLRSLQSQSPQLALTIWGEGSPQAYCFGRRGLFADHLGPWMSQTQKAAEQLLRGFLAQSSQDTVVVDCLKSNSIALELLRSQGFSLSRPLTRMVRGPNTYPGKPAQFCAILGPEFG